MQSEALAERDAQILREGLTEAQQAIFDGNLWHVEKWVLDPYEGGKLRDFQAAMSEALLALRRAAVSHDGKRPFQPFLDRTLKNAMEDHRLREKRRRECSFQTIQEAVDPEDGHTVGFDAEKVVRRKGVVCVSRRSRHWSVNRLSSVLTEVIRREAQEAYQRGLAVGWRWGWRAALEACGKSGPEIDDMLAEEEDRQWREQRNRQQREQRQRQRLATV